jgi:hypothetical protein
MKKILTLGTLLLGCCLAVVAQTGSTPNQAPQGVAPSASPQDQMGQPPANQADPAAPPAVTPDSSAAGQATQEKAADPAKQTATSQITTVQGCLSKSADGFMLADKLGKNYQLGGNTSQLAALVGKEVQVTGRTISNGGSKPGSMSSDGSAEPAGALAQISVSKVQKIADVCSAASATGK